jgi:two-component system, chemotaxis family, chemotaxis protein CheY
MAEMLVVDDDDQLRKLMCKSLAMAGHTAAAALTGVDATRQIRERVPDLMICDIVMPDMDGLELIQKVRREYPQTKILAVTGGGTTDPMLRLTLAKHFGAHDTLYKPFSIDAFLQKVSALLTS